MDAVLKVYEDEAYVPPGCDVLILYNKQTTLALPSNVPVGWSCTVVSTQPTFDCDFVTNDEDDQINGIMMHGEVCMRAENNTIVKIKQLNRNFSIVPDKSSVMLHKYS